MCVSVTLPMHLKASGLSIPFRGHHCEPHWASQLSLYSVITCLDTDTYLVHGVSVQVLKCLSKCLQLYHTCSLTSKIFLSFVVLFPWQAVHRSESEACKHSESMHSGEALHADTAHQTNIATKACTNRQASILLEYKHHMS